MQVIVRIGKLKDMFFCMLLYNHMLYVEKK